MVDSMDVDLHLNAGLQLFTRHPIYDGIFSCLTPLSLTRMASVSRDIRSVTHDFATRAYNINRRLSLFVDDPLSFRSLMARTHMVISGSFALQFFDRTYYPDSDLDLYLHPDRNMIDVGLHLMQREGYTFVPTSWQLAVYKDEAERLWANMDVDTDDIEDEDEFESIYGMRSLRAVYTFERRSPGGETKKIQLIISRVSPLASIFDFHSTCVMKVITYNAAYSLYPYATFERRDALVINTKSQTQAALAKYSARGWRILANPSSVNSLLDRLDGGNPFYSPWFFIWRPRWVRDGKSWSIPLDMAGVVPPQRPSPSSQDPDWDPVAECGWRLVFRQSENKIGFMHETIVTTIFRWRYTAPDFVYIKHILPLLRSQGTLEHAKIPAGKTKADIQESWTWWHHILPSLRKEYLEVWLEEERKRHVRQRVHDILCLDFLL